MNSESNQIECCCPRDDIAAYVDGELSPSEELCLETHFAGCEICLSEFNSQKGLLSVLESAMDGRGSELPMPEGFSRIVTVNAESSVSGIRSPAERYRALFVCSALFMIATLGVGSDAGMAFEPVRNFAEQALAVAGIVFHSLFDVGIGLGVVLRSFGQGVFHGSWFALAFSTAIFLFASAALSRIVGRFNRTS